MAYKDFSNWCNSAFFEHVMHDAMMVAHNSTKEVMVNRDLWPSYAPSDIMTEGFVTTNKAKLRDSLLNNCDRYARYVTRTAFNGAEMLDMIDAVPLEVLIYHMLEAPVIFDVGLVDSIEEKIKMMTLEHSMRDYIADAYDTVRATRAAKKRVEDTTQDK